MLALIDGDGAIVSICESLKFIIVLWRLYIDPGPHVVGNMYRIWRHGHTAERLDC